MESPPARSKGNGILEFPPVFADHEGDFLSVLPREGRLEDPSEDILRIPRAKPMIPRGEFFQPGKGGGEQKLSTRLHERAQSIEKKTGIGQAAKKVGRMHDVEGTQAGREVAGIPYLEFGPRPLGRRNGGRSGAEAVSFLSEAVAQAPLSKKLVGGPDEGVREINSLHLGAMAGQLESRATDGAPDVQPTGSFSQGRGIDQFGYRPGKPAASDGPAGQGMRSAAEP